MLESAPLQGKKGSQVMTVPSVAPTRIHTLLSDILWQKLTEELHYVSP